MDEEMKDQIAPLVQQVKQLVEQVQLMSQSFELMLSRSEQLFKLQEERTAVLPQLAEQLTQTKENLEVMHEAFVESLDQLDGGIDDLAKATAALLTIQQQQNAQAAAQQ